MTLLFKRTITVFFTWVLLSFNFVYAEGEAKVALHLLATKGDKTNGKRFWIDWYSCWADVSKSKVITGKEAEAIIQLLQNSL